MDVLENILNGLLWVLSPVFWLCSLLFSFIGHVVNKAYWVIVAVLGTALAYFVLTHLIGVHF
jgi:hypothetical protein